MVSNSDVVCHKNTVSIWLFVIISVNFALFISTYIVDVIRYELAESLTLFQRSGAKLNQRWNMVTYESWKIVKAVTFQRENSTLIQRSSVVNAFYIEIDAEIRFRFQGSNPNFYSTLHNVWTALRLEFNNSSAWKQR